MELKNLSSFRTVATEKSFSKAAQMLGYAQSTVTFQIKQLENELQVPVFDRIGNQIQLTDAGHALLDYTNQILSLSEEARNVIMQNAAPAGTLRIAGVCSLCANLLPPLIKEYSISFPAVTIHAAVLSQMEVLEAISSGAADIGLYMDFNPTTPEVFTSLQMKNPLYFISSPEHSFSKREHLTLSELTASPFVTTVIQCQYRMLLNQLFSAKGLSPHILFETEDTEVIKRFIASNIGIAFLPEIAVREELTENKLCKLSVTESIPKVYIHIIYNRNRWVTPAMREFLNQVLDYARLPANNQ